MTQYLLRRFVYFIPVIFLVTVVIFSITLLLPGDPALAFLGEGNIHDKVAYEAMRKELGLDQPIPVQYGMWVTRAVQGDFGRSIRTRERVLDGLAARLPVTLQLTIMA
jgi:peptide/nickel transport system permease protein